jgi:hypothetical protein
MRRKIVLDGMWSTAGVRQDVVRLPMRHYGAATDVAASRSLVKHMRAVARSQAPSTNPSCRTASDIPLTPSLRSLTSRLRNAPAEDGKRGSSVAALDQASVKGNRCRRWAALRFTFGLTPTRNP